MDDQNGDTEKAVRRLLHEIAQSRGDAYKNKLQEIVEENTKRGRLQWYLNHNPSHTKQDYVCLVMDYYDQQHELLDALQTYKDPDAWQDLQQQIQPYAYRLLRHWGFVNGRSANTANDVVQDASIEILFAYFPYDTLLKAWAFKITYYMCYNYAQQMRKEEQIQTELDKTEYQPHAETPKFRDIELQLCAAELDLSDAVQQLSPIQQDVILAHYIVDKSLAEIAAEADISPNTIYKRHYDALKKLGQILNAGKQ